MARHSTKMQRRRHRSQTRNRTTTRTGHIPRLRMKRTAPGSKWLRRSQLLRKCPRNSRVPTRTTMRHLLHPRPRSESARKTRTTRRRPWRASRWRSRRRRRPTLRGTRWTRSCGSVRSTRGRSGSGVLGYERGARVLLRNVLYTFLSLSD